MNKEAIHALPGSAKACTYTILLVFDLEEACVARSSHTYSLFVMTLF